MGINRRELLTGLGALVAGVLGPARARAGAHPTARACIFVTLAGGPSQLDTWDPKPGHPNGGGLGTIATQVPALHFSEHLPRMARLAHDLTVIRSMTGSERNHERALYLMHTSHGPQLGVEHPPIAAEVARVRVSPPLPGYVAIDGPGQPAGLHGPRHGPFAVRNPLQRVLFLTPPGRLPPARQESRLQLWRDHERRFAAAHPEAAVPDRISVWEQAVALMRSPRRGAFDLEREPRKVRERYGVDSRFGQGCLMARRLVEAGVPFVEVYSPGWDTHADNFQRLASLAPDLDRGLAALLEDLKASGKLDETLVVCIGEFGRTPAINRSGGRDHFSAAYSAVVAGARVPGGQVVGRTSDDGMEVLDRPVTVPDLLRTVAVKLGMDPDQELVSPAGRPFTLIDGGEVLPELGA